MKLDNADSQGDEERSAKIRRLREEIGRVIEREYALLGKFHELATSFKALIPDENVRHDAALQALSTTLKLGRQEIVETFNRQREELAVLEKAVGELFADIGAKITVISKQRSEGPRSESAAPAPPVTAQQQRASHKDCPMCGERITFDRNENRWKCYSCSYEELPEDASGAERKQKAPGAPPAPLEAERQKQCPKCAAQMHFHAHEARWLCYTCSHEESATVEVQDTSDGKRGQASTPGPAPAPSFAVSLADMVADEARKPKKGAPLSPGKPAGKKKMCPVCRKNMDWHELEKQWRCFYCGRKTR